MAQRLAYFPCRYVFTSAAAVAMAIMYGLESHYSITLMYMVNHTAINAAENRTTALDTKDGPFLYSTTTQELLISSYYWGYLVGMLPGGRFAEVVSGKWIVFVSIILNILCTALTPLCAWNSVYAVFTMRILQGFAGSFTYPGTHAMIARWAPPKERGTIGSVIYSSGPLGNAISFILAYIIAISLDWQYVFYIMAALSIPWLIFWSFFVTDYPYKHPWISDKEDSYLKSVIHTKNTSCYVPWKSIFKSRAFWGIFTANICGYCTLYTMLSGWILYMSEVLTLKMRETVLFSALPFFCMWIVGTAIGILLDLLIRKNKISVTQSRQIATWISTFMPAICMIFIEISAVNSAVVISIITISMSFLSGMFSGYLINHIDIAPNYAGTLMALTNVSATIIGILVPIGIEKLWIYEHSLKSWYLVYGLLICLLLFAAMVYSALGTAEEQEWNAIPSKEPENS